MKSPNSAIKEIAKKFAFRHMGLGKPNYPFGIEPSLLARIVLHIEKLDNPAHSVLEAGVARGMTTRFMLQALTLLNKPNPFYALDTFAGFVPEHLDHEEQQRGKKASEMTVFEYNDFDVWSQNFAEFPQLSAVQCDIGTFDFSGIGPIFVFLLDVDLYVPTKAALQNVVPHMAPGGAIFLDDILDQHRWDGAFQAFTEFTAETGLRNERVGQKSGAIYFD